MKMLFFALLIVSFTAFAETEFKIFSLLHHSATELIPIISSMVGDDGVATGTSNQLIVRARPEHMREIERTIAQLDSARANHKICIQTKNTLQSQKDGIEASGNVKAGKVKVTNNRRAPTNSVSIEATNSINSTSQNASQFINVLDSERAFIRFGQLLPFTEEWVSITRRYVQMQRFTDWREISTGFAIRTRSVGNQIELEITPRIAKSNNQGFIDFEELTTIFRVSPGTWVDLGGTMQNNDDVSRKILGAQHTSSLQNSSLMVKVD